MLKREQGQWAGRALGEDQPSGGQNRQAKWIDCLISEPQRPNREDGRDESADAPIHHDTSEDVSRKVDRAAIREQFASLGWRRRFSHYSVESWRTQRHRGVAPIRERPGPAVAHRGVLPGPAGQRSAELNCIGGIACSFRPRQCKAISRRCHTRDHG